MRRAEVQIAGLIWWMQAYFTTLHEDTPFPPPSTAGTKAFITMLSKCCLKCFEVLHCIKQPSLIRLLINSFRGPVSEGLSEGLRSFREDFPDIG